MGCLRYNIYLSIHPSIHQSINLSDLSIISLYIYNGFPIRHNKVPPSTTNMLLWCLFPKTAKCAGDQAKRNGVNLRRPITAFFPLHGSSSTGLQALKRHVVFMTTTSVHWKNASGKEFKPFQDLCYRKVNRILRETS